MRTSIGRFASTLLTRNAAPAATGEQYTPVFAQMVTEDLQLRQ